MLLKMLKHARVGVPMEVMGLMLGEFMDEYTVTMVDVFAMPQSVTGVSVEANGGGITTLVDMPPNSFPSTISEETLKLKAPPPTLLLLFAPSADRATPWRLGEASDWTTLTQAWTNRSFLLPFFEDSTQRPVSIATGGTGCGRLLCGTTPLTITYNPTWVLQVVIRVFFGLRY
ncbi:hypothetical protein ZWY2020_048285 [Hordeum vulgare]|nr:hypothetical protein ZWY2020_048285 [Hordeum vulgare]